LHVTFEGLWPAALRRDTAPPSGLQSLLQSIYLKIIDYCYIRREKQMQAAKVSNTYFRFDFP
jgi:hypothetical protein